MIEGLDVFYCEGWDPVARAAIGPLSTERAADRDRRGDQYAVLLSHAAAPLAVIEIAWEEAFLNIWLFDDRYRRAGQIEGRKLTEDRVLITAKRRWTHSSNEVRDAIWEETTVSPGGMVRTVVSDGDGNPYRTENFVCPLETRMIEVPAFGQWEAVAELLSYLDHELRSPCALHDVSDVDGVGLPADQRPWRPPRPRQARGLDELCTAGTRYPQDSVGPIVVELLEAGVLRLPTGRLVACDPTRPAAPPPFTTTVAPGDYPVVLSVRGTEKHLDAVAAVRLVVLDEPVAMWEPALQPGQRERWWQLGDGDYWGFDVASGVGCFHDSAMTIRDTFVANSILDNFLAQARAHGSAEFVNPASGGNLIAFPAGAGEGSYPTWIGRTADGRVACFLTDMSI